MRWRPTKNRRLRERGRHSTEVRVGPPDSGDGKRPNVVPESAIRPTGAETSNPCATPGEPIEAATTTTTDRLAECILPAKFETLVQELGGRFGLSRAPVLAATLVNSAAAIGNGVLVETPLYPCAVNAGLSALVCAEQQASVEELFQFLAQPLREEADKRLAVLATGLKAIQQDLKNTEATWRGFYASDVVHNPKVDAKFRAQIDRLRATLHPLLVSDNPHPKSLEADLANSGGAGLLVMVDEAGFQRFLDTGKKEDFTHFEILGETFLGRTPMASFAHRGLRNSAIRPIVASLLRGTPEATARLVCSNQPAVRTFTDQLFLVRAPNQNHGTDAAGVFGEALDFWTGWIAQMIRCRDEGRRRLLRLSRLAELALRSFAEEIDGQRLQKQRWGKMGRLKALKVGLNFHIWKADKGREISETTICAAMAWTRLFNEEGAKTASTCVTAEQNREIREAAAQMLNKLRRSINRHGGLATRRELYQSYDDESRALHDPVLQYLLDTRQVRWVDDKHLEPTTVEGGCCDAEYA